MTRRL